MADTRTRYDVIVCGGGLSGLTAALACAYAGLEVAVVDALDPAARVAVTFDGRASAVAYANYRMLVRLGVAARLGDDVQRIETILVTDGRAPDGLRRGGPGPAWLRFDADEVADREEGEPLGYMVENRRMRAALLAAAADAEHLDHIAPVAVTAVSFAPGAASVSLADGRALEAALVVGAEGRQSVVRRAMAVREVGWDYPQTGIVATTWSPEPHGGVAHEYFLPSGPFAILPLTGNRASLVWTERAAAAGAAMALDADDFRAEVRRRFGDFLGEVDVEGPRWSHPLGLRVAESFIAPRAVLVGDAARRVHPIAGQGFNLGLKDAAALADVLAEARHVGLDAGGLDVLERYQTWRRFDSLAMAAATDVFNRLYSNDLAPVRFARDVAMAAVNKIPFARRAFARDAGADFGDLPRLLRPL